MMLMTTAFYEFFEETSKLIRASARLCDRAHDDDDLIVEDELHYIEELLGISFVLLQAKIRRVEEAAKIKPLGFADARAFVGPYKDTNESLVSLIWAIANYYKHHNEWGSEEWSDEELDRKKFSKRIHRTGTADAQDRSKGRYLSFIKRQHAYSL
jgi:hypothetical protein